VYELSFDHRAQVNPAVRASQRFFSSDHGAALNAWLAPLKATTEQILTDNRHGDYPRWLAALGDLPDIEASRIELDRDAIAVAGRSSAQSPQLRDALMRLCPWRKGPFNLFDCHIDSEWACNLKWQRLLPHLHPLSGRRVLDLGCGNGYYCLRLLGAGAASVCCITAASRCST